MKDRIDRTDDTCELRGSRVAIVGLGDLAHRLASQLIYFPQVREVVLVGRASGRGPATARLLNACGRAAVRFVTVDATHVEQLASAFDSLRPDLVVQCGSLMSPWLLSRRSDPAALALQAGGFALQLPAQLPIIWNVVRASRMAQLDAATVNCSYPDVTHAMLSGCGLRTFVGIGNVGMILGSVRADLRGQGAVSPLVRVVAQHGHVAPALTEGVSFRSDAPAPQVYLGEVGERADELATAEAKLPMSEGLNVLSAAHALEVICACLPGAQPIRTSAPGPNGLLGGYPVRIAQREVTLDLPPGLSLESALEFQRSCTQLDGISAIRPDGTAIFTDVARAATKHLSAELSAPLHPGDALERFGLLARVLGVVC